MGAGIRRGGELKASTQLLTTSEEMCIKMIGHNPSVDCYTL